MGWTFGSKGIEVWWILISHLVKIQLYIWFFLRAHSGIKAIHNTCCVCILKLQNVSSCMIYVNLFIHVQH